MKIIYSCFTKIGASGLGVDSFELVRGIYARGYLKRGVFYGNCQSEIPGDFLRVIQVHPFHIFSGLPARYYYPLKRIYLDWVTARLIRREGCDIFHGWSTESLQSLRALRAIKGIGFVERPSPHPEIAQALMEEEYALQGMTRPGKKAPLFLSRVEASHRDRTVAPEEFDLADRIVLESDFSYKSFIQMGFPKEKLLVIPRGVDTGRFHPASGDSRQFRLLFAGQLCFRKGIHYLLAAWKKLKLKEAELWILGDLNDEVRAVVHRHEGDNSIRFFGFVKDTVSLFQEASLFILPSIVEGSAKVTYEAMACGLPVVVTPNAGSVARDGEEGFVVPIRDTEALAERILVLYRDRELLRAMGERARLRMETHTWEDHRQRMLQAYGDAFRKY